jgi:hypothetical protein
VEGLALPRHRRGAGRDDEPVTESNRVVRALLRSAMRRSCWRRSGRGRRRRGELRSDGPARGIAA